MSTANPNVSMSDRQELLDGLEKVHSFLRAANHKLTAYFDLERAYREDLNYVVDTRSMRGKSEYTIFVTAIAVTIYVAITAILTGNIGSVVFCGVVAGIFVYGRNKGIKLLYRIGLALLILIGIAWIHTMVQAIQSYHGDSAEMVSIGFFLLVNALALAAAFIGAHIVLKRHRARIDAANQEIAQHNQRVAQHRADLLAEINAIIEEMKRTTGSWYPPDYYVLDAAEKFISYVRNYRADSIGAAVNLYCQEGFQNNLLQGQAETNTKLANALHNQERMIKLQRITNVLLAANLATNMAAASRR